MRRAWPLERVLFALAGSLTLLSVLLALLASPWFLLFVAVGACPASRVLERVVGIDRCRT